MNQKDWERLVCRVNNVEAQNRRMKLLGSAVGVVVVMVLTLGQSTPSADSKNTARLLEAERFVVRDKQGRVRASLGTEDGGSKTALKIFDESGDSVLAVTVADEFCGMGFYPKGGPIALIWAKPDLASLTFRPAGTLDGIHAHSKSSVSQSVATRKGDHKAEIGLFHNNAYVALGDKNSSRGEWMVTETGDTGLKLLDKAGKTRAELAVSDSKGTFLRIFDKAGITRGTWGLEANDKFMLNALNDTEGTRAAWAVYRDGTTWIKLVDKDGNIIFSAP